MIMKLHTLTPHESRMCPIDFGVKRSTVKVMAHGYLKMVHRNNGCRFEFVGVGGGPVLLQQYFQYAFTCCPYMLPLLLKSSCCLSPTVWKWVLYTFCNNHCVAALPCSFCIRPVTVLSMMSSQQGCPVK